MEELKWSVFLAAPLIEQLLVLAADKTTIFAR